jgi:di-N-acetylchitobiase
MDRMARSYAGLRRPFVLPAATAPPAPAPPSLAAGPPIGPHEIFGFLPYWTLPTASGVNVSGYTTLSYFSVDVNSDGSIVQGGPGWIGYQSQALADLVTRAHGAGDRVVLTATCFGQAVLDKLATDPNAPTVLATSLVQLVSAKNLDGVNIDFEGKGSQDQAGLDHLVATVSAALRQANPHWQLTMDTYASAAGDRGGFYDIAGLNPSVDAFFVMAYDMNNPNTPSPTAPLTGAGFTDLDAVQQYASVVPPSKVILGVPYYGYDWPTAGPGMGDPATGPPSPMSYAAITAMGAHIYWDPVTETPWTSYQVGNQWHQTWFDDPTSLTLKARLANTYHIGGLGIWALGMEGRAPAMLAALLGNAPVVKDALPGPPATVPNGAPKTPSAPSAPSAPNTPSAPNAPSTPGAPSTPSPPTTTTTPTFHYTAIWNGAHVTLVPIAATAVLQAGALQSAGQLTNFTTDDPGRECLASSPPLNVESIVSTPGIYLVSALTPTDCTQGSWEFSAVPGTPTTTTTQPTTPTTLAPSAATLAPSAAARLGSANTG